MNAAFKIACTLLAVSLWFAWGTYVSRFDPAHKEDTKTRVLAWKIVYGSMTGALIATVVGIWMLP